MAKKKARKKESINPAVRSGGSGSGAALPSLLQRRSYQIALAFAFFLIVLGARWWLIGKYGSDLPYWDQWDAEAVKLYKPFFDGSLHLTAWFAPHNEHRIFFSRILAFGLLLANGQWDARLQMLVNAFLYACTLCILFLALGRGRSARFSVLSAAGMALLFALPFGWENTLAGFQSQFYFLVAFSFAATYLLLNHPAGSRWWIAGAVFGSANLIAMASGLLAPAAVLGASAAGLLRERSRWKQFLRERWATVVVCLALIAIGMSISVRVEFHVKNYQAHSVGAFLKALITCLSWPNASFFVLIVVTWFPFLNFLIRYMSGSFEDGVRERFILAMGIWVLLQAAAMAFSRSIAVTESRYTDILSFGILTNALSASLTADWRTRTGRAVMVFMMIWLAVISVGLYQRSFNGAVAGRKDVYEVERTRTAGYLATGDFRFLSPVANQVDIPYPDPKRFAEILHDPAIVPLLPAGVRTSIPLVPADGSPAPSVIDLAMPAKGLITPESWDRPGIFSRFAVVEPGQRFSYTALKTTTLPYLYFVVRGDYNAVSVRDSHGEGHRLHLFPDSGGSNVRRAYAYCPTKECTISGTTSGSGVTIMEPKEMGFLSVFSSIAAQEGDIVFLSGLALFAFIIGHAFWSSRAQVNGRMNQ